MSISLFLAFAGACVLLFLKPGPAMSVIVANSVGHGVRGGMITTAGNVVGMVALVTLVAFGLAWIAEAMRNWFDWIRLGGAAYLLWLGIMRTIRAGRIDTGPRPTGKLMQDGLMVAIANPEVILFLAAFLPPFVDPAQPVVPQLAILAATFLTVSALAGVTLALLAGQARSYLSGPRLVLLDRASGLLLIAAAIWLAWPRS